MNEIFTKMNNLIEHLSKKPKLIEITYYVSHIKINNLDMIPPITNYNLNKGNHKNLLESLNTENEEIYPNNYIENKIIRDNQLIHKRSSSLNNLGSTYTKLDDMFSEDDTLLKNIKNSIIKKLNNDTDTDTDIQSNDVSKSFEKTNNSNQFKSKHNIKKSSESSKKELNIDLKKNDVIINSSKTVNGLIIQNEKTVSETNHKPSLTRKSSFTVQNPSSLLLNNQKNMVNFEYEIGNSKIDKLYGFKTDIETKNNEKDLLMCLIKFRNNVGNEDNKDPAFILHKKLGSLIKGYLIRRILKTNHVQNLVKIIRDTTKFAIEFQNESPIKTGHVTNTDIALIDRIISQLQAALQDIHIVFFETTIKERMEIINQDRQLKEITKSNQVQKNNFRLKERAKTDIDEKNQAFENEQKKIKKQKSRLNKNQYLNSQQRVESCFQKKIISK